MTPGIVPVVLIDFGGTGVSKSEMADTAHALTLQLTEHVALPPPYGWGMGMTFRVGAGRFDVRPGEWILGLFAQPDQPGALGYHDVGPNGKPYAKVFPLLDKQDGVLWSTTASHEAIEMAVDPLGRRSAQGLDGRIWALEACDQVEAQSYDILGVKVSDFNLPANFEPWGSSHLGKLNWLGNQSSPMEVLPGGYAQYYDPNTGWQQVEHAEAKPRPYRKIMSELVHGRAAKRRVSGVVTVQGRA